MQDGAEAISVQQAAGPHGLLLGLLLWFLGKELGGKGRQVKLFPRDIALHVCLTRSSFFGIIMVIAASFYLFPVRPQQRHRGSAVQTVWHWGGHQAPTSQKLLGTAHCGWGEHRHSRANPHNFLIPQRPGESAPPGSCPHSELPMQGRRLGSPPNHRHPGGWERNQGNVGTNPVPALLSRQGGDPCPGSASPGRVGPKLSGIPDSSLGSWVCSYYTSSSHLVTKLSYEGISWE